MGDVGGGGVDEEVVVLWERSVGVGRHGGWLGDEKLGVDVEREMALDGRGSRWLWR